MHASKYYISMYFVKSNTVQSTTSWMNLRKCFQERPSMIQFLMKSINFLRRITLDVLSGDRWFLILDPTSQETLDKSYWTKDAKQAVDERARNYEKRNQRFTKALSLTEAWTILNPLSILEFLRYSLSDIV